MMNTRFGLLASFVILLAQGCEPEVEPIKTFVTRKGDHYAYPRVVESLQSRTLAFDAMFNETAIYDFGDLALQSNKNKLFGFSDCNSLHHQNSARFAWQWFNERLEIYAYCYVNGERIEEFVGVVALNEFNHYQIEISEDHYTFILNNETPVYIKRGNTCERGVYYMLWPYFGGHIPAPHDVQVFIRVSQ
ncbi:MAG: hypothetical protein AB7O48_16835 [Cyclobacteriaceae bacterium]